MKVQFNFSNRESFKSTESTSFARLLMHAPSATRLRVQKTFGIKLDISSDPIRVSHDGRRIGLGGFASEGTAVQFAIGPKVGFRVFDLIQRMANSTYWGNLVDYGQRFSAGDVTEGYSDFSPSFLVELLQSIASYTSHHVDITHGRRKEFAGWKVRGRIVLGDTLRRLGRGRLDGLVCEVYDDRAFQDYADILCATADSIVDALRTWHDVVVPIQHDILASLRLVISRLGHLRGPGFSIPKLIRVCRPPFPLGLRELLYQCLRYWQWRGEYNPQGSSGMPSGYWELAVRLDDLFEAYVGETWSDALASEYDWQPSPSYPFAITTSGASRPRKIELDHRFIHRKGVATIVADAKYRTDVGTDDQIYQMMAYLSYLYPDRTVSGKQIGVLVYPGVKWDVDIVTSFEHDVYCVTMPITTTDISEEIRQNVTRILGFNGVNTDGETGPALAK